MSNIANAALVCCIAGMLVVLMLCGCKHCGTHPDDATQLPLVPEQPDRIGYCKASPGSPPAIEIDDPVLIKRIVDDINNARPFTEDEPWYTEIKYGGVTLEFDDGRESIDIHFYGGKMIQVFLDGKDGKYYHVQEGSWFDNEIQEIRRRDREAGDEKPEPSE